MAKILKIAEYYAIVTLIYKQSNYNKNKALTLYTYTAYNLVKQGFNHVYIDKLIFDLNLIDDNNALELEPNETAYKKAVQSIDELFDVYTIISIKASLFDILHKGYYE